MKMLFIVFFDPKDLGCRYLSAYLEKEGHETRILALKTQHAASLKERPSEREINTQCKRVNSAKAGVSLLQQNEISPKELQLLTSFISEWKPDVIGFGTRSLNFRHLPRIIPAIRKGAPNAPLLAGGFGPSLEPEVVLKMGVDAVIRGEGEYILAEMLRRFEKGSSWKEVPGVATLEQGKLVINNITSIEKNLDNYPFPFVNKENIFLIDNDRLQTSADPDHPNTYGQSTYIILSTRGCPAECSYCGGRALRDQFKKEGVIIPRIRRRSLNNVLEELRVIKNDSSIRQVAFYDEFFIHPVHEMVEFFKKYAEEINLPFHALLSPDQVAEHPEMLEAAADAGLLSGAFGLQTGNESFCRAMYNRINHNRNIQKSVQLTRRLGLNGWLFMILGNPLEKKEHFEDTLNFISSLPPFDESLRTRFYFETNKLRIPYGNPPIIKQHPELLTLTSRTDEFYYNAMLLEFRLLMNDYDFNNLRRDFVLKKHPHELGSLYHETIRKRHEYYLREAISNLKGKMVNVYGGGKAYLRYKSWLKDITVNSFIIDSIYNPPQFIEGIPVSPPDRDLISKLPLLLMANIDNVNSLWRKVKKISSQNNPIVTCGYIN